MLWGRLPRNRVKQTRVFLMVRSGYRPDRGFPVEFASNNPGMGLRGRLRLPSLPRSEWHPVFPIKREFSQNSGRLFRALFTISYRISSRFLLHYGNAEARPFDTGLP